MDMAEKPVIAIATRQQQLHPVPLPTYIKLLTNGQTTQNCEQHPLPMKIMTVLGTAHMLAAQLIGIFS